MCEAMKEDLSEKEALAKLLVDGASYATRLANAAYGIVGIDKNTGKTIYVADTSRLTDEEKIFLVLLARYFSNKLGKSTSDWCTPSEIADESGLLEKTVSKRLSDLENNRIAQSPSRGQHSIVPANAEGVLFQIKQKIGDK